MKRLILLAALCLFAAAVQAKGVPFAVESLDKAQSLAKQSAQKHVLVFYTSEN